ncbi:acyltransferase family protein [Vibrio cyclitrophicus]
MSAVKFRPDIDTMRAFAVISVIIYHFNENILPGGFVGVDIFLVISGFLITKILISPDRKLSDFYLKRIKRILPLTYVVIISSLIVGYFYSSPNIYLAESNTAISALLFLANIRFSLMGNYFQGLDSSPLLHLWSLSLEEQFYVLWPGIIVISSILGSLFRLALSFLILLVAIIFSYYLTHSDIYSSFAYFILPTRMVGLLVGCIIALLPEYKLIGESSSVKLIGILGLIASVLFIPKDSYPGTLSIIPALSAALVVISSKTTQSKLYSNPVILYIGKISFSLYMWHWPILVFSRRLGFLEPTNVYSLFLYLLLIFCISVISYNLIETPMRNTKLSNKKTYLAFLIIPILTIGSLCLYVNYTSGIPQRFGLEKNMTKIDSTGCHGNTSNDSCSFLTDIKADVDYIGDSHAGSLTGFFKDFAKDYDINMDVYSSGGCQFFSDSFYSLQCEKIKDRYYKKKSHSNTVVLVYRLDILNEKDLINLALNINKFIENNQNVVLVNQVPLIDVDGYDNARLLEDILVNDIRFSKYNVSKADKVIDDLKSKIVGIDRFMVFDPGKALLLDNELMVAEFEFGYPIYYDNNHLTSFGSHYLYRIYKENDVGSLKTLADFIE